jgi:hypothetical protein
MSSLDDIEAQEALGVLLDIERMIKRPAPRNDDESEARELEIPHDAQRLAGLPLSLAGRLVRRDLRDGDGLSRFRLVDQQTGFVIR